MDRNGPFVIIFLKEGFEEILNEKENKEACNICFEVRKRSHIFDRKIPLKDDTKWTNV